jgi:RHS repeat-associated protein
MAHSTSLLTKTGPEGTTTYDYDFLGNLRGVALPDGTQITYVIDGRNRRVGKKVNGALVEGLLYRSQLQPTVWLNSDRSIKATFSYAGGNAPAYMVADGKTYRFVKDQGGSVREVVESAAGTVVERIDYDEFGRVLADSAPGFQPFGFAGGLRDLDTGLTRFGARDYDAQVGRWTTKDPLGFAGGLLDLYSYVSNDPIDRKDPSGLQALPLGPPPPPALWLVPPPPPPVPYAYAAPTLFEWLLAGSWASWLAPLAIVLTPNRIGKDRCSDAYPSLVDCGALGPAFRFDTEAQAFKVAKMVNPGVRKHTREKANMCEEGTHVNLRCGGDRAGSLVCCPCCENTSTGISHQSKCAYIP